MAFSYYVEACQRLMWELTESLSDESVEELREDCTTLGIDAWIRWTIDNMREVSAYTESPPSRRLALKKWRDPVLRNRLVLAGIQRISLAYNLLSGIVDNRVYEGLSYREMASRAGEAFHDICHQRQFVVWPFDDPNPFGTGS